LVVHDEDPLPNPIPADWNENKRTEKERAFKLNAQIAALVKPGLGSVRMFSSDFEGATGVSRTQGEKKGKALAALDHFEKTKPEDICGELIGVIDATYGPAASVAAASEAASR